MRRPRTLSSSAVMRGRREISFRYFFSDSEPPPRDVSRSSLIPPPESGKNRAEYTTRGRAPREAGGSADLELDRARAVVRGLPQRHDEHAVLEARARRVAVDAGGERKLA